MSSLESIYILLGNNYVTSLGLGTSLGEANSLLLIICLMKFHQFFRKIICEYGTDNARRSDSFPQVYNVIEYNL